MCELASRKRYPSDLTDAQWQLIEPFIPKVSAEATVPTIERREIVNAILYVLRTGCSWRQMPHDLPNGKTAHHYFRIWTQMGIWEPIMTHLSLGAPHLLDGQHIRLPRLKHLFADKASRGPLRDWIAQQLGWTTEIVPGLSHLSQAEGQWVWINVRPVWKPTAKPSAGFVVQRKRWVVERTLAWLTRFRRLSRNYEGLTISSEALIQVASIRLMLQRLAPFRY